MIPIIKPDVSFGEVADDLRTIFESGQLTSGRFVAEFERSVAEVVGLAHAVSTTSATTALHLVLAAAGIGPGDEVLVSDFTFPASGNVICQLGATPVLVDSAPGSFAIDADHAASLVTERTRAIMPVDPFGQPAPLPALAALAEASGLLLVEDAACALGASIGGRSCGAFGAAGCFSFHPRKVVTSGEGGMITTHDDELAETLRRLRSHGAERVTVGMTFVDHGFNYRLGEVPAAMALAQMRRFGGILGDRRATAMRYIDALSGIEGIRVPTEPDGQVWTFQSFVVVVDDDRERDRMIEELRQRGIETTLGTYAMHAQPAFARYGYSPGQLPESWAAQQRTITLPLLPHMEARIVDHIAAAVRAVVGQ